MIRRHAMRKIKIKFTGFWNDFVPEKNFITDILRRHYEVEISEQPDYVFYSVFSDEYLNYDNAVRIFYTGEYQTPDFNLCDYGIGFDYLDFGDRYLRMPLYVICSDDFLTKAHKRGNRINKPQINEQFCSFVYSNSRADLIRTDFYNKLSEYKKVASGGRYMNNIGEYVADKTAFESNYKFSVAFENCSYPGYITEKLLGAFAAGTVPIYWGDPRISDTFNDKAFINVNAFDNLDDAIDEIKRIDADDAAYSEMLSQPVFIDENHIDNMRNRLETFIVSVIDRDKGSAFRRNRSMRGNNYELYFKRYGNLNMNLKKIKNIFWRKG